MQSIEEGTLDILTSEQFPVVPERLAFFEGTTDALQRVDDGRSRGVRRDGMFPGRFMEVHSHDLGSRNKGLEKPE